MHQKRRDSIQRPAFTPSGRRRHLAVLLGCLLFASAPGVARATSVVDTWIVPFVAQPQSLWAPGTPAEFTGPPQGTTQVGGIADGSFVKLNVALDAGSVSGNVEGSLSVKHPDVLAHPGLASIDFQFTGNPDESKLKTSLGGGFKVTMGLRLNLFPFPNIFLDVSPGANSTGSLSCQLAIGAIGGDVSQCNEFCDDLVFCGFGWWRHGTGTTVMSKGLFTHPWGVQGSQRLNWLHAKY